MLRQNCYWTQWLFSVLIFKECSIWCLPPCKHLPTLIAHHRDLCISHSSVFPSFLLQAAWLLLTHWYWSSSAFVCSVFFLSVYSIWAVSSTVTLRSQSSVQNTISHVPTWVYVWEGGVTSTRSPRLLHAHLTIYDLQYLVIFLQPCYKTFPTLHKIKAKPCADRQFLLSIQLPRHYSSTSCLSGLICV